MFKISKKTIAERLIHLRTEKNVSQVNLATIIGVSQESISSIETAKTFPKTSTLLNLCVYFGCSLDYIVGLSDVKNPACCVDKLTTHEQYLINSYSLCSSKNKDLILLMCRVLANEDVVIEFSDETSIVKNFLSYYDMDSND